MAGATRRGRGTALRKRLERVLTPHGPLQLCGLRSGARAAVVAELARAEPERPLLLLASSAKRCDSWMADLRSALGERDDSPWPRVLPRHDTLPYERFSPQPLVVTQRVCVLSHWLERSAAPADTAKGTSVVVSDWTALALRVPSRETLHRHTLAFEVGATIDRDELVSELLAAGYARMPLVEEPGELAVRGGIVDLFPPQRRHPVRVEFFGDEIDSIRDFDPASQRSQTKLSRVVAPPARELLFDRSLVIERGDRLRELAGQEALPEREVDRLIDTLLRGHLPPGIEALAPILQPAQESVLDYLPEDIRIVIDDPDAGRARLARYHEEAQRAREAALESKRLVAPLEELLVEPEPLENRLATYAPLALERLAVADPDQPREQHQWPSQSHDELRRELARARTSERALTPLADRLAEWILEDWRVVICVASLSAAERMRELLTAYGLESQIAREPRPIDAWSQPGRLEIRVAAFSEGFALPEECFVVLCEEEIFGRHERRRARASWREGVALDALAQLAPGDPLVHADHGIGIYRGLVELHAGGTAGELLCIEYAGGDKLFLPVDRLNRVQRYGAFDAPAPRLDRLGGETWQRARKKVAGSLRHMAHELLSLHAARELAPGFAFSPRDAYFEEFEAQFGYEETPDQSAAIDEVLADMQRPRPMDRLVCGDVGYGKTEVAIRAAFRAAMDAKQVIVLVPTTVLCQQHYETFRSRFAGYPIEVEMLSRFRSPREARRAIEGLAEGRIDIVVATHRILHARVRFRDLGLLVIDEEQRFGVAHKERIKKLRKSVDVLTLTATPIPRTLQMAFTGLRDLSVIETPPVDRLAIRTQVCRESETIIREAILREVRRGGQIFFLHNRVASIHSAAEMLARIVPEVRVIVAHGQMRERQLENRMRDFLRGEADVLLCTTIIENGLDIPRANTILIDCADRLGLAQLYQLRGRVGRSSHRAYAYFLIPGAFGELQEDAQRRLEAIQDLSELGSGFRLASMDLEIRGAGDLLGSEQSGNLRAVGYDTYMEMLDEAIETLRGEVHIERLDPEIRLPIVACLPDTYVPEVNQRLVLYKRLASCRDSASVAGVRDELLDRYGPLPAEAQNLLDVLRLKRRAGELGIASLMLTRGEFALDLADTSRIDLARLVEHMKGKAPRLRATPDRRVYAPAPAMDAAAGIGAKAASVLFDAAWQLLDELAPRQKATGRGGTA